MKKFFDTWWTVIVRPIFFFTLLPEGDWKEEPVTFAGLCAWILSAVASAVIFITQYVPIGATLVEGIKGFRFLIITPVMLLLAIMFYLMTFVILGGVMLVMALCLFYGLGWLEYVSLKFYKFKVTMDEMIKSSLYGSAILVFMIFPLIMALCVKKELLTFSFFIVGFNVVYFLSAIYFYGLISIAAKQRARTTRWQALLASAAPLLALIIIGIVAGLVVGKVVKPFLG